MSFVGRFVARTHLSNLDVITPQIPHEFGPNLRFPLSRSSWVLLSFPPNSQDLLELFLNLLARFFRTCEAASR